jgi:hypothetical protein
MEARQFARTLEWDRERTFPELGVAVLVESPKYGGNGVVLVRELLPHEKLPKLKRLTNRRKKD